MRIRGSQIALPAENTEDPLAESPTPFSRADLDHLFSVTYEELRRLAALVRSSDQAATINPTTLVHQAWMKLANSPHFVSASPLHFKRVAARAMRQLLVDSARRRHSQKRGGDGSVFFVALDEAQVERVSPDENLLRLDEALKELARLNPRQAAMVEARFFGGLELDETAELLQVSQITILRDWRAARAWLAHELRRSN